MLRYSSNKMYTLWTRISAYPHTIAITNHHGYEKYLLKSVVVRWHETWHGSVLLQLHSVTACDVTGVIMVLRLITRRVARFWRFASLRRTDRSWMTGACLPGSLSSCLPRDVVFWCWLHGLLYLCAISLTICKLVSMCYASLSLWIKVWTIDLAWFLYLH